MDNPVEPPSGGGYDALALRVTRLESDVRDMKDVQGELKLLMAQIAAQLPYLATKSDIQQVDGRLNGLEAKLDGSGAKLDGLSGRFDGMDAKLNRLESRGIGTEAKLDGLSGRFDRLETRVAGVEANLAEKPSRTYMWGILGVLLTAYACGLAALAVLK